MNQIQNQAISSSIPHSPRRRPSHHQDEDIKEEEHRRLLLVEDHADDASCHEDEAGGGYEKETGDLLRSGTTYNIYNKPTGWWPTHEDIMSWMGTVLFLSLIGCFILFIIFAFSSRDLTRSQDFRRIGADYILDPDWDFDAPATTREYTWEIVDIIANPDGIYRPMITIDGRFPGPMVRANEHDTVRFTIINKAENSTSIHFHGMFQNGTNWMDGTSGVTQCPIPPGRSFVYEFKLTQSGTYMYHAHHGAQSLDGLFGPFIIHSPLEKDSDYATDRVLMVQDWYHDLSAGLLFKKLSPGSESSPIPDGVLINGKNIADCSHFPTRDCDTTHSYIPIIDLPTGSSHRLRIINSGAFAWFDVSIDDHADVLDLVEVDGVAIEPNPEQRVVLGPGQRYSVVMQQPPDTRPGDDFFLRARMIKECFSEPVAVSGEALALVSYHAPANRIAGARTRTMRAKTRHHLPRSVDVTERATECKDMTTSTVYKPIPAMDAPEVADHSWPIRVNMQIGNWRLERGYLNDSSFRPQVGAPTLHRFVEGLREGNQSFSTIGVNNQAFHRDHEMVISQNSIEVVDIVLQNLDEGNHPFHIHGYEMFVLGQGHGYFPGYETLGLAPAGKGLLAETTTTTTTTTRNVLKNPPRRDTATVEGFGWLLVRFIADNPGIWYFHCHIAWHEAGGMGMQFASRLDMMKEWTIPQANLDLCSADISELSKGLPPDDGFWEGAGLDN